jgi:hypothetical protein
MGNNNLTICISHGSSGLGETEYQISKFFSSRGYQVVYNNYFEKNSIDRMHWHNTLGFNDSYKVNLKKLCEFDNNNKNIVHIGLSFGGYIGLVNSDKFVKNYCFYPGVLPMEECIKNFNLSNTTIFLPEFDNWCKYPDDFFNNFSIAPNVVNVANADHGFMSVNKDRIFEVIVYDFENLFVPAKELEDFILDHALLMNMYQSQKKMVRIKSNVELTQHYLSQILNDIRQL